jgi:hypothetical protein
MIGVLLTALRIKGAEMNREKIILEFEKKFGTSFYLEDTIHRDDALTDVEAIEKFLLSKIAEAEREAVKEYDELLCLEHNCKEMDRIEEYFAGFRPIKHISDTRKAALARRGIGEDGK